MKKKLSVIKAGGEMVGSPFFRKKILRDLKRLSKFRHIIFVHGGGPQIEEELRKNRIPAKFVKGRRVTSPAAMIVVERILSGEVNKQLAAELSALGVPAFGVSGRDGKLITGRCIPGLGRAAHPVVLNTKIISTLLKASVVPVVSSVASDKKGNAVNINADDVASALATTLKADQLIFLTNISGVLDHRKKRIAVLKIGAIDKLVEKNIITGGMIPKVQSARLAINRGVGEVDIVNAQHGINIKFGTSIIK